MADRAEQRALETYPMETGGVDCYPISRAGYIAGYHQAEKDLALTIEDIKKIDNLMSKILYDTSNDDDFTMECVYQEVLERFNESRK